MSPFAAADTLFHQRMVETRSALRAAVGPLFGGTTAARLTEHPPARAGGCGADAGGVYALPEWRDAIEPYHCRLIELWRQRGVG